jgi:Fic family protein
MDAVDRARRLKDLQIEYTKKVRKARASALLGQLIEELFNFPMVNVAKVSELLKVHPSTAQKHIARLLSAGILRETTGRKRDRLFVAEGILEAIEEPQFGNLQPEARKG